MIKSILTLASLLLQIGAVSAFTASLNRHPSRTTASTTLHSTPTKKGTTIESTDVDAKINGADVEPTVAGSKADGLPWWWELVWKLDIMKKGNPGEEIIFGDSANVLRTNIEQIYGGYPSLDGCPIAEGDITDIADGTMFIGLQRYQEKYQRPYKLCFGPKSFLVISDPVQARHLLRDANTNYDKVRGQKCDENTEE